MKFHTEIQISPFEKKIGYENRILAMGSCFAEHIAGKLAGAKFRITSNPTGILFNPLSIASAIDSYAERRTLSSEELLMQRGLWFHYDFHGSFADISPEMALARMNLGLQTGANALRESDRVFLTFGTAWVYELKETGCVVANCHKQPAELFLRRRLSVAEIAEHFDTLLDGVLRDKQVLFTVSPVRHLGDGLQENSLSKATLRLAIEELCQRHGNAAYFPAYEVLMDDLRDYRFYADDLVHPSSQAIEYTWELFSKALLSDRARQLLPAVTAVTSAARHRPLHPESEEFQTFCRQQLETIGRLHEVDFTAEKRLFEQYLE